MFPWGSKNWTRGSYYPLYNITEVFKMLFHNHIFKSALIRETKLSEIQEFNTAMGQWGPVSPLT